jgi:hypothetical protein
MSNQISVSHSPDENIVTVSIVGDDVLSFEDVQVALSPLQALDAGQELSYRLVGFTPAHFLGWTPEADWSDLIPFMGDRSSTGDGPDWHELIVVGCQPPSPGRLAELLSDEDQTIRELAVTWMAPRIEWPPVSELSESELSAAAEAAKQAYRRERRRDGKS